MIIIITIIISIMKIYSISKVNSCRRWMRFFSHHIVWYLAAAGQSDWGWACRHHNWRLPPTEIPACSSGHRCSQPALCHCKRMVSYQQWVSLGSRWLLAVHRVSTCWGKQRRGEHSRAAEVEYWHTQDAEWIHKVVELGVGCEMMKWWKR